MSGYFLIYFGLCFFGQALVKWKSRFYRGDTGNSPSKNLNDESAVKAMKKFIQNGLKGLKKSLE